MDVLHIFLIVLGIVAFGAGIWLFRYLGRHAEAGDEWVRSGALSNVWVFLVLGFWCGGLGLVGFGFGLGGMH